MALGRQMPMQNDEIDDFGTDQKSEALSLHGLCRFLFEWLSMLFKSLCMIGKVLSFSTIFDGEGLREQPR